MKPSGKAVAAVAVSSVGIGYTYDQMDCQAFVRHCVNECGGNMTYRSCNDPPRHAAWLGTIENAKADGKLVPGAGLLIYKDDQAPARYSGDGLGNFSHIALYVGENALTDTDKKGKKRTCNAVHSSENMGRVAGTTVANGYTHVMLFEEIDYGITIASGVSLGSEVAEKTASNSEDEGLTAGTPTGQNVPSSAKYVEVVTPNGGPVKLRKSASKTEPVYWLVNSGAIVRVERQKGNWSLVTAICADGHTRRAYIMSQFLRG